MASAVWAESGPPKPQPELRTKRSARIEIVSDFIGLSLRFNDKVEFRRSSVGNLSRGWANHSKARPGTISRLFGGRIAHHSGISHGDLCASISAGPAFEMFRRRCSRLLIRV